MRPHDRELLIGQLREALDDVLAGQGDAFEVAVLAGLLVRHKEAPSELISESERWRDGAGADLLDHAIAELPVSDIASAVLDADDADDSEERVEALLDLDETCAATHWCDATFRIQDRIDLVTRTIETFPERWHDLATLASSVLGGPAAPLRDDPAYRLWACIEATRWHRTQAVDYEPVVLDARRRLGLRPVVSLARLRPRHGDLATAADSLPQAPPWEEVGRGESWELFLTADESGAPMFHVAAVVGVEVSAHRGGTPVELAQPRSGVWVCPAVPGAYHWRIGADTCEVEVEA